MDTTPPGHLHVITGPMFAGKTIGLLNAVTARENDGHVTTLITHTIDTRRGTGDISTHTGQSVKAQALTHANDIPTLLTPHTTLVAIDEAQFFGPPLITTVTHLLHNGLSVIIAGLCVTFDGQPFSPLPELMALADEVEKLTARCSICGAQAPFHQPRDGQDLLNPLDVTSEQIGGSDLYHARCRRHFTNEPRP